MNTFMAILFQIKKNYVVYQYKDISLESWYLGQYMIANFPITVSISDMYISKSKTDQLKHQCLDFETKALIIYVQCKHHVH